MATYQDSRYNIALPSGAGGAILPIKTLTASSSATLSFVDGTDDVVLDSTYRTYVFKFIGIHPSADAVDFRFQVNAAGGSGYNETITSTSFMSHHYENDTSTGLSYSTGYDQAQGTSPQIICENVGNGNDECGAGELWIFNPSSTTYVKHFMARSTLYAQSDYTGDHFTAGYINNTAAIDEVQFTFESGNIDAGTIKLYGIA
jgi:hypothetical protein